MALIVFLVYLVYGIVPPINPSDQDITHGYYDWSLDTEPIIYGKTIWSDFSDNVNHSIKVYYCIYTGGYFHEFNAMYWEVDPGNYSSASLNYFNLLDKWDGSTAAFRYKYNEEFFRVSFSIPKLENGLDKYDSLKEAWNEEELHQIVEKW